MNKKRARSFENVVTVVSDCGSFTRLVWKNSALLSIVLLTVSLKVLYNVLMINTISVTDLKQNIAAILKKIRSEGKSMVIMQRSQPAAVIVDPTYYEVLEEALEDAVDLQAIEDRKDEPRKSSKEIAKKLGLSRT